MSETLIVPTVTIKLRLGYPPPVLFSPAMDIDYEGSCCRYRDDGVWHRKLGAAFGNDTAFCVSRSIVTDRFGSVTGQFGIVTEAVQ